VDAQVQVRVVGGNRRRIHGSKRRNGAAQVAGGVAPIAIRRHIVWWVALLQRVDRGVATVGAQWLESAGAITTIAIVAVPIVALLTRRHVKRAIATEHGRGAVGHGGGIDSPAISNRGRVGSPAISNRRRVGTAPTTIGTRGGIKLTPSIHCSRGSPIIPTAKAKQEDEQYDRAQATHKTPPRKL